MSTNRATKDILGTTRENEFLQSFVGVGLPEDDEEQRCSIFQQTKKGSRASLSEISGADKTPRKSKTSIINNDKKNNKNKPGGGRYEELYTDKDRAAACSFGSFDIKQSLKLKRRKDRNEALMLPTDADSGTLLALGMRELKSGNTLIAVQFITKALELNPNDQNALVARSKSYLSLGEPAKALNDAETALIVDKANIRAIYQKAEALYYLGQFEHSLMFFHRGLRLRPELNSFRLGIQKTQEAIENTIGAAPKQKRGTSSKQDKSRPSTSTTTTTTATQETKPKPKLSKADNEKKISRKLLGELYIDKEYLENLLKNPDLKRADTDTENISVYAQDAVNFLNIRQEFWRQQRPCSGL